MKTITEQKRRGAHKSRCGVINSTGVAGDGLEEVKLKEENSVPQKLLREFC